MAFNDELTLFLKARYPILYITTIEEDRVEYTIRKTIKINLLKALVLMHNFLMLLQIKLLHHLQQIQKM
jgi:hypothetical protein